MRLIFLCLFLLSIAGCGVEGMYGISDQHWSKLSPEQKKNIIAGYEKVQGALEEEQENYEDDPKAEKVRVAIYGGEVLMPPFNRYHLYEPITVTVADGQCEYIDLFAINEEKQIKLGICYNNKVLEVDPSMFIFEKRHGTVALKYSPIWQRGFTYKHVTTSGYARLNNAHIYVLKLS